MDARTSSALKALTARPGHALGAALIAGTLLLAGCSTTSNGTTPSAGSVMSTATAAGPSVDAQHNAADVTFAQDMIVHHQGAIQMAIWPRHTHRASTSRTWRPGSAPPRARRSPR
jgi:uncharacterized protein (DUF305 family)